MRDKNMVFSGCLMNYDDFHKNMNWCLECHGRGFKYVDEPYRDYKNRIHSFNKKIKCKKCNGTGEFTKGGYDNV